MPEKSRERVRVLGVTVDPVGEHDAVREITTFADQRLRSLVVTANLDHAVRIRRDRHFRDIYARARLVLADGFPLLVASRLRGPHLPERVTGADLIRPICREASARGQSIFVVGTTLGILSQACRRLVREFPKLQIAGVYAPSFGFSAEHPECRDVAEMIRATRPSIVFVALGSPKQERWVDAYIDQLPPAVYLCVGSGFDYLARRPPRAPASLRRFGLEWLWRLMLNPRKHARRCALDAVYLPVLLLEHFRQHSPRHTAESALVECRPDSYPAMRRDARAR